MQSGSVSSSGRITPETKTSSIFFSPIIFHTFRPRRWRTSLVLLWSRSAILEISALALNLYRTCPDGVSPPLTPPWWNVATKTAFSEKLQQQHMLESKLSIWLAWGRGAWGGWLARGWIINISWCRLGEPSGKMHVTWVWGILGCCQLISNSFADHKLRHVHTLFTVTVCEIRLLPPPRFCHPFSLDLAFAEII